VTKLEPQAAKAKSRLLTLDQHIHGITHYSSVKYADKA